MSGKRQATTELNHENWDKEDPSEHEDMGTFKPASQDVLEKRVIKTAKRRSQISSGDEAKKSVFSGFGGFNKTQPSSFDFLANLTNGNKTNGSPSSKSETTVASSPFSSNPLQNSPVGGLFNAQTSPLSSAKSTFGSPTSHSTSLFSSSSDNKTSAPSVFPANEDTTSNAVFKIPTTPPRHSNNQDLNAKSNKPHTQAGIFGTISDNTDSNTSLFSSTSSSTLFKQQTSPITTSVSQGTVGKSNSDNAKNKSEEKKLKYFAKLKGLNESVSDWIKKHVEDTPLCILSPIFKDYERYLKEMQEEYHGTDIEDKDSTAIEKPSESKGISLSPNNEAKPSVFANTTPPASKTSLFSSTSNASISTGDKTTTFSFGIKPSTVASNVSPTSAGFSFGSNTTPAPPQVQTTPATSSQFSFGTSASTSNTTNSTPFSFGTGKPFSFNTSIQANTETKTDAKEEDDEPPKVEFTPVVEENSVYDKRCKIFIKKDGNFVDKGVGTLYIKKIEETGKHQLLVRANTNLGNVLLNLILASGIPTQRMGKNNVMLVCIPTPDSKPPPTPILIRVKTSDEADELLETLDKYKA